MDMRARNRRLRQPQSNGLVANEGSRCPTRNQTVNRKIVKPEPLRVYLWEE